MTKTRYYIIASLCVFTLIVASCSTTKKASITTTGEINTTNSQLKATAASYLNWNTFSTSGKITIGMGQSLSSSMQIRMVRDKFISVSLRPLLGIEMGKLFISSDSIVVIDKFHKAYLKESLQQFNTTCPMSLAALQDLFLNRIFSLKSGTLSATTLQDFKADNSDNGLSVTPRSQYKGFSYSFQLNNLKQLTQLLIVPSNSTTKYAVEYADFAPTTMGTIASNISAATRIGKKDVSFVIELNTQKIKWNTAFEDAPSINSSYRRITAQELPELLKQL